MKEKRLKLVSLSVFFPCFNEEKNIGPLVKKIHKLLPEISKTYEIIIINDGSADGTSAVLNKLVKEMAYIRVVNHNVNRGYGAALRSGIKAAKYKWVFFTDGDGQFNVSELKKFIPHTSEYSVVIGYRINRAEGNIRAINAKFFRIFINLLFRVGVQDIDCAYKLMKTSLVQSLKLQSNGAMISAEMLYRLKKKGIEFKQVPVKHYLRQYGQPTGNNPRVIIKAGVEAFKLYVHMKFGLG